MLSSSFYMFNYQGSTFEAAGNLSADNFVNSK